MIEREQFEREAGELATAMYKLAISLLRSDADARDAVQQALLKAWEKRRRIRAESFRAYLMRILINECHNTQRYRMRVFPSDDMPERVDQNADHALLREALLALPERLRTPVVLKYLQDLSERECAQALGISVAALKSRLYRARRELKRLLDREVTME